MADTVGESLHTLFPESVVAQVQVLDGAIHLQQVPQSSRSVHVHLVPVQVEGLESGVLLESVGDGDRSRHSELALTQVERLQGLVSLQGRGEDLSTFLSDRVSAQVQYFQLCGREGTLLDGVEETLGEEFHVVLSNARLGQVQVRQRGSREHLEHHWPHWVLSLDELLEPEVVAADGGVAHVQDLQTKLKLRLQLLLLHFLRHLVLTVPFLVVVVRDPESFQEPPEVVLVSNAVLDSQHLQRSLLPLVHSAGLAQVVQLAHHHRRATYVQVGESFALAEGLVEAFLEVFGDVGVLQQERLQAARDLDQLVDGLSRLGIAQGTAGEVDVLDLRGEGEVVEDGVRSLANYGVVSALEHLHLLCPHQPISDLFSNCHIDVGVAHVHFLDELEVGEDFPDGLRVLGIDGVVLEGKHAQFGQALEALVQVLAIAILEQLVQDQLVQLPSALLEVLQTLQQELEPVLAERSVGVGLELESFEGGHPSQESHQVVVVLLELSLVQSLDVEAGDVGTDFVHVFVKQFEVLVLGEVEQHLLEAKLEEELSPGELLFVVVLNGCLLLHIHQLFSVQAEVRLLEQDVSLLLDLSQVTLEDRLLVRQQRVLARLQLLPALAVGVERLDPGELLEGGVHPLGSVGRQEFLLFLVEVVKGTSALLHEVLSLLVNWGNLIDTRLIAVVALLPAVGDGLFESLEQSFFVGAGLAKHRVVLLEVLYLLDLHALVLERVLRLFGEAAVVLVEELAEVAQVLALLLDHHLVQEVEEEGDVETGGTRLEAGLGPRVLHDHLLVLVLFVFVVQLRDLLQHPEHLSVQLLLKVSTQQVIHVELLADKKYGVEVTEGRAVVLDSFLGLFDEGLHALFDLLLHLRVQLYQHTK